MTRQRQNIGTLSDVDLHPCRTERPELRAEQQEDLFPIGRTVNSPCETHGTEDLPDLTLPLH